MKIINKYCYLLLVFFLFSNNIFAGLSLSQKKEITEKTIIDFNAERSKTGKLPVDGNNIDASTKDMSNAERHAFYTELDKSSVRVRHQLGLTAAEIPRFQPIGVGGISEIHENFVDQMIKEKAGLTNSNDTSSSTGLPKFAPVGVAGIAEAKNSNPASSDINNIDYIKVAKESSFEMLIKASAKYKEGTITKDQYIQVALQVSQMADYYNKTKLPTTAASTQATPVALKNQQAVILPTVVAPARSESKPKSSLPTGYPKISQDEYGGFLIDEAEKSGQSFLNKVSFYNKLAQLKLDGIASVEQELKDAQNKNSNNLTSEVAQQVIGIYKADYNNLIQARDRTQANETIKILNSPEALPVQATPHPDGRGARYECPSGYSLTPRIDGIILYVAGSTIYHCLPSK